MESIPRVSKAFPRQLEPREKPFQPLRRGAPLKHAPRRVHPVNREREGGECAR